MSLLFKNLLFTVIVPGTAAGYVPAIIVRSETVWHFLPGAPFFVTGLAIYAWTVWDFATKGRGTPAPVDAPKNLVIDGLYRYVRNPMYLGVLCVLLGWAVLYLSTSLALYTIVVWICFHLFAVLYEEPHLRKVFGADYIAYCHRTGRWLPRLARMSLAGNDHHQGS